MEVEPWVLLRLVKQGIRCLDREEESVICRAMEGAVPEHRLVEHRQFVETEHAQSDQKRGEIPPPQDHWRPFAKNFRADPHRTGDPLVNRLLQEVEPHHTVMDVGAGGGRLALPLALRCAKMVAVEPSSSMCQVLREQATDSSESSCLPTRDAVASVTVWQRPVPV